MQSSDQRRLDATVASLRPKLLLLDPLVRLHRLDESSSGDISGLLGYLRELERRHAAAVVLVHHMGKRHRSDLGQALRGSSDVHAWTDASLYLTRKTNSDSIVLSVEHRSAQPPEPSSSGSSRTPTAARTSRSPASAQTFRPTTPTLLPRPHSPIAFKRSELRGRLAVNNQRLGEALAHLENQGRLDRSAYGWALRSSVPF